MRIAPPLLLLAAMIPAAHAVDGDLDPTFSVDGKTTIGFDVAGGTLRDTGLGIVELPGGKTLAVAVVAPATATGLVVGCTRLTADGLIDTAYGVNGRKTLQTTLHSMSDVVVDASDRIALVGSHRTDEGGSTTDYAFRAEMIDASCQLVTGFGSGGKATADFDLGGDLDDTALRGVWGGTPRKLYLVGSVARAVAGDIDIGVAAFDASGQLSTAFDGDGKRAIYLDLFAGEPFDFASSVAYANGKLVVGGQSEVSAGRYLLSVSRLDANTGAFDATFCPTTCAGSANLQPGLRSIDFYPAGGSHFSMNLDVAPDDRIYIAAALSNNAFSTRPLMAVTRLLANGTLDESYGLNQLQVGQYTRPRYVKYTALGFVVAGDVADDAFSSANPHSRMYIGRLQPNSSFPDAGFASSSCTASAANWCTFATFPPQSAQPEIVNLNGGAPLSNGQFMLVGEAMYRRVAGSVEDFDIAVARFGTSLDFADGFE